MKIIRKSILSLVAVVVIMATSVVGCSGVDGSRVVATIGDTDVTLDIANFYLRMQQAQYETYFNYDENTWESSFDGDGTFEESIRSQLMDSLTDMFLLEANMEEYDVELTEEEEERIATAARDFFENNGVEERNAVSGEQETVARVLTLITIRHRMHDAIIAQVDDDITDEEVAQKSVEYVTLSIQRFDEEEEEMVPLPEEEVAQLRARAEEFRARVLAGESFEAVAEEMEISASTQTFDYEGERWHLDRSFLDASYQLEVGGMTEVVESESNLFVGRLTSLLDREATDERRAEVFSQRQQDYYQETLARFREETDIEVFERVLSRISFIRQGVLRRQMEEEQYDYDDDVEFDDIEDMDYIEEDSYEEPYTEAE